MTTNEKPVAVERDGLSEHARMGSEHGESTLDHYQAFTTHTGPLRASIEQSAAAAEAEIEAASDRARGK